MIFTGFITFNIAFKAITTTITTSSWTYTIKEVDFGNKKFKILTLHDPHALLCESIIVV